jgi:ABC-type Fe3+/spermidine/putrescine transport system ATPase subunit
VIAPGADAALAGAQPMVGGAPLLSLSGLGCTFGEIRAVDRLYLDLDPGEFVSLLGPSGCGKTTTLRMIAGFIDPTAGTIALDGTVISSPRRSLPPERRQMSMIFQSYAIWPNMTVADNVAFGLQIRRLDRATIARKVDEMLRVVRLEGLAERYPTELSGGQQQRVALARAMIIEPRVLLLDEPLSNLDATLREEMRFEIRRLHDAFRYTTVYVTHDQGEAMVTSDRIAVMNHGRIEQIDSPYTLYTKPRTRFVAGFIGRTNFLRAQCADGAVLFDGFALPRDRFFETELAGQRIAAAGEDITFSVRPQSVTLRRPVHGADDNPCRVAGTLVERAFLGEFWDYVVQPRNSALRLKVTTAPTDVFEVGEMVLIEFDPRQMAPVHE